MKGWVLALVAACLAVALAADIPEAFHGSYVGPCAVSSSICAYVS